MSNQRDRADSHECCECSNEPRESPRPRLLRCARAETRRVCATEASRARRSYRCVLALCWELPFCFVLRRGARSGCTACFLADLPKLTSHTRRLVSIAATTAESRSSRTAADERKSRDVSRSEPFDASHARGMLIDLILSAPRNDAFVLHHLKVCRSDPCGNIPTQSPHWSTVANASSRNY